MILLLIITISSCKTTQSIDTEPITLPPEPQGFYIESLATYEEAIDVISRYQTLCAKWQVWAANVEAIVFRHNNPQLADYLPKDDNSNLEWLNEPN